MTAQELRERYTKFFESKGHTIIPSASLVPGETDASTLFTTAGMHPLVPYLLGQEHPGGKRVVNVQKCVRTGDIDDVGDNRHLTFFEMMGNWSFGDYFKKEAIEWSFEFLTDKKFGLGLDPKRLYITVFKGEPASTVDGEGIPRDEDAISIWKDVFAKNGMEVSVAGDDEIIKDNVRIIPLGKDDNFWIAGSTGPCGSDTEMFYDTRPEDGKVEGNFTELVDSFRLIEIWNDVFMEFNKTANGKYEKLAAPNVDTGMGVERTLMVLAGKENVFETEMFVPILDKISEISGEKYEDNKKEFRIIADHIKSATFMIADGVLPSNTDRGYVLRRIIRRAIRHGKSLGINNNFTKRIAEVVIDRDSNFYKELQENSKVIVVELEKEEMRFRKTLENGLRQFDKLVKENLDSELTGVALFNLFQTFGFPLEVSLEIAKERGVKLQKDYEVVFDGLMDAHRNSSRTAAAGKFKGGLQDSGDETIKLHTTAHLLLAALREVLGDHVHQKGSNINPERLRLDFSHPEKMTDEEKAEVEKKVNEAIKSNAQVTMREMTLEEAREDGAEGVFDSKYGDKVMVYTIEKDGVLYSKEMCGGPHIENTGELGEFKIKKEESSSSGVRRIKGIFK